MSGIVSHPLTASASNGNGMKRNIDVVYDDFESDKNTKVEFAI